MSTNGEHWLDLLAARQTRTRLLKTALAGAVLTLPFASSARSGTARAEANCARPCHWTRTQNFSRQRSRCETLAGIGAAGVLLRLIPVVWWGGVSSLACQEYNFMHDKAAAWDCEQPNCAGYDPKGPGGPCEHNNGPCCPCSGCDAGFMPCTFCCNKAGTGCGYGSDCGG